MKLFGILILQISFCIANINAQNWPLNSSVVANQFDFSKPFPVIGTFSEYKNGNFNRGIDIYAIENTPIYAVEDGVCIRGVNQATNRKILIIGKYWYENIKLYYQNVSQVVHKGDLIGTVDDLNYLHFRESESVIEPNGNIKWINPLANLSNYQDNSSPVIKSVKLIKQANQYTNNLIYGAYDIIIDAFDPATLANGDGNYAIPCGINQLEIQFYDNNNNPLQYDGNNITINYHNGYNSLPKCDVENLYFQGSENMIFRYIATNDPNEINPTEESNNCDKYWNSLQKKGGGYNENAIYPGEALFPDGNVIIKVTARDIKGNTTVYNYGSEENKFYAILKQLTFLNSSVPQWSVTGKDIDKGSVYFNPSELVNTHPVFTVISDQKPTENILIKANYTISDQQREAQTTGSYNSGNNTITANSPNFGIQFQIDDVIPDELTIIWNISFDNGNNWLNAGTTKNSFAETYISASIMQQVAENMDGIQMGSGRPENPESRDYDPQYWDLGKFVFNLNNEAEESFWLLLKNNETPSDAILDILNNPTHYSFDCAEYIQLLRLSTILNMYMDQFDEIQGKMQFNNLISERLLNWVNYHPGNPESPPEKFTIMGGVQGCNMAGNELDITYMRAKYFSFNEQSFISMRNDNGIPDIIVDLLVPINGKKMHDDAAILSMVTEYIGEKDAITYIDLILNYKMIISDEDFLKDEVLLNQRSYVPPENENHIIADAPIGSRIAVTNLAASFEDSFRNENAIKVGYNEQGESIFAANPFSYEDEGTTFLTIEDIKYNLATHTISEPDETYINTYIYVSQISYFLEPEINN